ncbi:MAG: head-tail adaptor protein [Rickettsiaceae bacterium]|nr:head-tail adaptor protein [Rickettsiaceae bacterium]
MKKQSQISRLVHKITFLENKASAAIEEELWEESLTSFAEIKPVCDSRVIALEGVDFGNMITEEYFIFRTRFIKGIHRQMRIKFHERIFEIKRIIDEDERGKSLNIIGLEV